ncbi:MAG: hypothetical protein A2103_04525 [Gammaproteobacteria bacterium GWF2_41_13]|nr:MAG: hypothetical protein A2103_04525 [Gammaproteobacteria bacterium GWF2_41_13]
MKFSKFSLFCFLTLITGYIFADTTTTPTTNYSRDHMISITPSGGYYHFADKRHLDDQALANIQLGYGFTEAISAEAFYAPFSTSQDRSPSKNIHGGLYTLNGLYHFRTLNALQPYVTAGVGLINIKPSPAQDSTSQANLNAGAGIEYFISHQFSFRAEAKDLYTPTGGKQDFLLNAGLTIYLYKIPEENTAE